MISPSRLNASRSQFKYICAPGWDRTNDLLVKSELLYRLSYGREVRWNKTSPLDFVPAERAAVWYSIQGASRICISTTYHPFLLVAKRVYRFSVYVQKLHDLAVGAPQRARAAEIDAPGVALKVDIVFVRINTPIVIEVLNHKILTGT